MLRIRKTYNHTELIKAIHPRKGLLLTRWRPVTGRAIDMLVVLGMIDWEVDEEGNALLVLTSRGKAAHYRAKAS